MSYGQAGLSVLQSFGHGVPFITSKGAISGGEIENIIPHQTGFLCDLSQESLTDTFVSLCNYPARTEQLGYDALHYYQTYSSAQVMVAGFSEAIENTHSLTEQIL